MSAWYNLNSIVDLQKGLIYDLSGSSTNEAKLAINNVGANLTNLGNTVSNSSVLPTLTYQNEVNSILDRENTRLAERKQAIDTAEMGQKRLVDLTTSQTLRNKAINNMYIVITIAILVYLGIQLLIKTGVVSTFITDIMFIFLVTGTVITLVTMYYDYDRRNNMDYNIINLGEPKQMTGSSDSSNSSNSSNSSSKNLLDMRFGGCIKDACCAEGTTFNDKYSICVPNLPPNDGTQNSGFKYFIVSKSWEDPATKCLTNGYSLTDLSCNGNVVSGFTTMSTSDFAKPSGPHEFVDYNLYK
jgi:hypothetical protein